ncbi:MAG: vWA domain-containing protein [Nocardioides sp.]
MAGPTSGVDPGPEPAGQGARAGRAARYRRYAGGDPLAAPVDLGEALDAIGEDVMAGYSTERAMREFLRRGGTGQTGLDDLAARVAARRRQLLEEHRLDGTLAQVRELLDRAVLAERKQLARDLDDDARFGELRMENLPPSTAAAVSDLSDYGWRSPEARAAYDEIKDLLGREALDQRFTGMKQALEGATDADRAAVNAMLEDLNQLLDAHRRGEDTPERFDEFMAEHGQFFPENPRNVEELIDALAARAAAGQRMLNSMTPEQRQELMRLSQQAFGSPRLMQSLGQLDDNLRALRPGEDWGGAESFDGEQGLGLGDGTGALQDLAELDRLAEQLSQSYDGAGLDDVDLDALARQLGEQARVEARALAELERALRDSGMVRRGADGQLKLSPKAMRQLGQSLLRDVARQLSGRQGAREARRSSPPGMAGEPAGGSRPWAFGDTEPWDVTRTITNAVRRAVEEGTTGARRAPAVRIDVSDVEIIETEARTQACVALLVDTSFSMAMEGRWVPMKRTALALHTLIRTRFRGDALQLIGFGRYAEVMEIEQLTALDAKWDKGTNLHHALMLANRHFRKHPHAQPVLLIVTDGEPTAHLESGGGASSARAPEAVFAYPPHPLTIANAVRELDGASRFGARTTFFRLGDDPGLARFVASMARRVDGRVVAPEVGELGSAVMGSYLDLRGK